MRLDKIKHLVLPLSEKSTLLVYTLRTLIYSLLPQKQKVDVVVAEHTFVYIDLNAVVHVVTRFDGTLTGHELALNLK